MPRLDLGGIRSPRTPVKPIGGPAPYNGSPAMLTVPKSPSVREVEGAIGRRIPYMDEGGDVKETGVYKLQKGEKVVAKKRGEKAMGGKKKDKKKPSRQAKEISFSRMKSGHLKAKHRYEKGDPMEEEHLVPEGGADEHLQDHLMPPEKEAMGAPSPSPGGMLPQ